MSNSLKIISFIASAVLILFGVLFILATFSSTGQGGWLVVGVVLVLIAFGLIWLATRQPKVEAPINVTYKVDLPGDVSMDTIKCKSCGGTLSPENIKMVNGAPVVTCPYCNTTYQLTEQPKW